ncbi:hypothetical protein HDZ31DRAFT_47073 [Schizophyllum fasciatum]
MIVPDAAAFPWTAGEGAKERRWFESRDDGDDGGDGDGDGVLSKTVLEWLFLAIAIFLLFSILARRLMIMKRANQPVSDFFRVQSQWMSPESPPRPSRAIPCSQPCPRDMAYIAPLPSAHPHPRRARRTRGANTDGRGRRLDWGGDDYASSVDEKDVLPAYDKVGGPPEYEAVAAPPPVARGLPPSDGLPPLGDLPPRNDLLSSDDVAQLPRSASAEDIIVQLRSPPQGPSSHAVPPSDPSPTATGSLSVDAGRRPSIDASTRQSVISGRPSADTLRRPSVDSSPPEAVPLCPPAPPPSPDRLTT